MEGLGMSGSVWQDRPTFVTGPTGLLGSWLIEGLLRPGADVVCLVRDWVPQSRFVRAHVADRVKVVRGDVRDQALLERICGEYEIDTVFHLAGQTLVPVANRNPVSTFEANVQGTWAMLEACRRSPTVRQVVVASSDKAYGDHEESLPYDERTPLEGRHPYDVAKSCADLISQAYAATYELPVAVTRCGNFYGGGDLNWNRIVPGTIRSVLRGKRPIIRSDGRYVRDYFYVEDAAHAYIQLAEALTQRPELRGEAFNFSYEQPLSVLEIVTIILSLMNSDLRPEVLNEATHEIRRQCLSADKARRELGWQASLSLEEGLLATIQWYTDFLKDEAIEGDER